MESILEALYSMVEPVQDTRQEREALDVFRDALEKACPEAVEQLWDKAMGVCSLSQQRGFCRGFRLGMQTAVEGLRNIEDDESL